MEFKDELDALGVKVDGIDKRVAVLEDRLGGWKFNGMIWFDARFASNADNGWNSYTSDSDKTEFGFAYARLMITKYFGENNYFFARFNPGNFHGDLSDWSADRFFVEMQLPWDVTFTLGRQNSDWEGDAGLYHSVMGDLEGGIWKDQTYDGFNFKKSFGMVDAELLIGRNDDMISDKAQWKDADDNVMADDDNAFMEYGLKLQANFSEKFYVGIQGVFFDADGDIDWTKIDSSWTSQVKYGNDNLDLQQYGAYLSYSFTPAVALRGYYYWQDLDDGWVGSDKEDKPMAWSVMLDVKQDLLKFTSLWVQYVAQDNAFVGPRAANQYPAIFAPGLDGPAGGDGTNKTLLITAEQQWNDKWSSFVQYLTTDWDHSGYDDTDQYMIGVGYQYAPAIKFWLAYNYIDYGDRTGGYGYTGSESVVLFRTAIDF